MILWVFAVIPAIYGFAHDFLPPEVQSRIAVPWWAWVIYYVALFAVHFEFGVVARIRELEEKVDDSRPEFQVSAIGAIANEDRQQNKTLVFLTVRIVNHRAPSTVLGYAVRFFVDDTEIPAKIALITNAQLFPLPTGDVYSWRPEDAIHLGGDSIPRGAQRSGKLPILLDGLHMKSVMDGSGLFKFEVRDYLNNISSCEFRGTGPAKSLGVLVGEPISPHTRPANQPRDNQARRRHRRRKR